MWFTKAVVVAFAGAIALIGVGLMGAGRADRKSSAHIGTRDDSPDVPSLQTVGVGLFVIGLVGVLVDLAG